MFLARRSVRGSREESSHPRDIYTFTLLAACSFWVTYTPRRAGGPTPIPRVTAPTLLCEWRTTRDLMGATSSAGKAADTHGRLRWITGERGEGGLEGARSCNQNAHTRNSLVVIGEIMATEESTHTLVTQAACQTHMGRDVPPLLRVSYLPSTPLRTTVYIFRLYPVMCTVFRGSWHYSFPAKSNNYHLIR